MIDLVSSKRGEIEELCEAYGVQRLALFGSAVNECWHAEFSDIDFLVDIGDYNDRVGKRFMGFLADLDRLFDGNIDVVSEPAIKSDTFRSELQRTAVTLYERPSQ